MESIIKTIKLILVFVILGLLLMLGFFFWEILFTDVSLAYVRYHLPEHIAAIVLLAVSIGIHQWMSALQRQQREEEREKVEEARRKRAALYESQQAPVTETAPAPAASVPDETPRSYSSSSSYSSRSRMATAHFDGRHLNSANNLTVYIDGDKVCSYDGGSTRSVQVTPGDHVIRVLVYNDAAEDTYWLGPFPSHFEEGTEYDISYG